MMRIFAPTTIGGLIAAVALCAAPAAHAQLVLTGLERPLTVTMSPEYPAAGDTVSLSVSSFSMDLDRSTVAWFANSAAIAQGSGATQVTVTAPTLGSALTIDVVAESADGILGSGRAVIRPTEVDLLWESDSYVPPFFQGRARAGTNATIRAQAIVRFVRGDGTTVPENDIIYSWYQGSTRIATGRGRSNIIFPGPSLFAEERISVVAESVDNVFRGSASARIASADPSIELYENHPLFGVLYHRALIGDVTALESQQRVTAVPYFAHTRSPRDSALTYAWRVNDVVIPPDPAQPENLIITSNGYTGPARIQVALTSAADIFLRATGAWNIVFGQSSTSIFGTNPFGGGGFNQ